MFIIAVYGVLYRSVCVGTGGLCSPGSGRGVCSGGQVKEGLVGGAGGRLQRENKCVCVCVFVLFCMCM